MKIIKPRRPKHKYTQTSNSNSTIEYNIRRLLKEYKDLFKNTQTNKSNNNNDKIVLHAIKIIHWNHLYLMKVLLKI